MSRRHFLKSSALAGVGAMAGALVPGGTSWAQSVVSSGSKSPIRILMGGYGPASSGFSLAMKQIGDRLTAKFPGQVEFKYVYNILDLGYRGEDILWLVEQGVLTLGYQSSSYFTERVSDLGVADLPFPFP